MKIIQYQDRDAWLAGRLGKITGSRAGKVVSKVGPTKEMMQIELQDLGVEFKSSLKKEDLELLLPEESKKKLRTMVPKLIGFYELIAERIAKPANGDNPMDRGTLLEPEAIACFEKETGKKVNTSLVIWQHEENESIAVSPDGFVEDLTEAVEAKCLASARHIEAYLTKEIPDEYREQAIQYFGVNKKLQKLHFAFYDPRLITRQFFIITFDRANLEFEIAAQMQRQIELLEDVNKIVAELTF